jgi:hypothetical protein
MLKASPSLFLKEYFIYINLPTRVSFAMPSIISLFIIEL